MSAGDRSGADRTDMQHIVRQRITFTKLRSYPCLRFESGEDRFT
jgi:hypothetical protein